MKNFSTLDEKGIYTDLMREFVKNDHKVYVISPTEKRKNQTTSYSRNDCMHNRHNHPTVCRKFGTTYQFSLFHWRPVGVGGGNVLCDLQHSCQKKTNKYFAREFSVCCFQLWYFIVASFLPMGSCYDKRCCMGLEPYFHHSLSWSRCIGNILFIMEWSNWKIGFATDSLIWKPYPSL